MNLAIMGANNKELTKKDQTDISDFIFSLIEKYKIQDVYFFNELGQLCCKLLVDYQHKMPLFTCFKCLYPPEEVDFFKYYDFCKTVISQSDLIAFGVFANKYDMRYYIEEKAILLSSKKIDRNKYFDLYENKSPRVFDKNIRFD